MRISIDWLKQFVSIKENPADLAEMLSMLGLEAEPVHDFSGLSGVVIGKVATSKKHPNAEIAVAGCYAEMFPEELAEMESAPGSLEEALNALKEDHDFLLKGDVFTKDVIEYWINYKMENEVKPVISRPHPHEFYLYYDI